MLANDLISSISNSLEKLTSIGGPDLRGINPDRLAYLFAKHQKELVAPVEAALTEDQRFKGRPALCIRTESGRSSFSPRFIAPKLVARAVTSGSPEAAVKWLDKVLAVNSGMGTTTMTLWGLEPFGGVEFSNGVSLLPFKALPDSRQKRMISGEGEGLPAGFGWSLHYGVPPAALVFEWKIERIVEPWPEEPELEDLWVQEMLRELWPVLSILGPTPVTPAYAWFNFNDPDLEDATLGGGTTSFHAEVSPMQFKARAASDPAKAVKIVNHYLKLDNGLRGRVRRSLDRLNQGLKRRAPGDGITDLVIGLESLLGDGPGENTYKLALRAALLLGTSLSDGLRIRSEVKAAYSVRNDVVHNGTPEEKYSVHGRGKIAPSELASDIERICAGVISRIVELGEMPSWKEFELSRALLDPEATS